MILRSGVSEVKSERLIDRKMIERWRVGGRRSGGGAHPQARQQLHMAARFVRAPASTDVSRSTSSSAAHRPTSRFGGATAVSGVSARAATSSSYVMRARSSGTRTPSSARRRTMRIASSSLCIRAAVAPPSRTAARTARAARSKTCGSRSADVESITGPGAVSPRTSSACTYPARTAVAVGLSRRATSSGVRCPRPTRCRTAIRTPCAWSEQTRSRAASGPPGAPRRSTSTVATCSRAIHSLYVSGWPGSVQLGASSSPSAPAASSPAACAASSSGR